MKKYHIKWCLLLVLVILLGGIGASLTCFNLSWIETIPNEAKITINFLVPMNHEHFEENIKITALDQSHNQYSYQVNWLNTQVVEIKLKEEGKTRGHKIELFIDHAPSTIQNIYKSSRIPVQFKTEICIKSPQQHLTISSTKAFSVIFNTPISLKELSRAFQCEVPFLIEAYHESSNENLNDKTTQFIFKPSKPLENGKVYSLVFKAGMRAVSGVCLKQDLHIELEVDQKPTILEVYPNNRDKWIGLYPRFLVTSKENITGAIAKLNGKTLNGILTDKRHAYFLADELLLPETNYSLEIQVKVKSGEVSEVKKIEFSTTSIDQDRIWLDIHYDEATIDCYQGKKKIRRIPCQFPRYLLPFGTYYLQGKQEIYEDDVHQLGGNYWIIISGKMGIQGDLRDAYWQPITMSSNASNLVISDEHAAWLYEKVENDTMVTFRR